MISDMRDDLISLRKSTVATLAASIGAASLGTIINTTTTQFGSTRVRALSLSLLPSLFLSLSAALVLFIFMQLESATIVLYFRETSTCFPSLAKMFLSHVLPRDNDIASSLNKYVSQLEILGHISTTIGA